MDHFIASELIHVAELFTDEVRTRLKELEETDMNYADEEEIDDMLGHNKHLLMYLENIIKKAKGANHEK